MKRFLYILGLLPFFIGCAPGATEVGDFTALEHDLINKKDSIRRVLTIADRQDSLLLRKSCQMLSAKALLSDDYE